MNNIVPVFVGLIFGSMPIWMSFVINPLWSARVRKTILFMLVLSATFFYVLLFTTARPEAFADSSTKRVALVMLVLYWIILIYRTYKLWPRKHN